MEKDLVREMFDGDELAISVWKSKYALNGETHYDQMHRRMAVEFARIEKQYDELDLTIEQINNLSKYGRDREVSTQNSIYNLFKDFKYVIPQGSIMSQLGSDTIGSLSNCFVVGQPFDSYGGVFEKDQELAQLMKRRGGVGIDISTLRPNGAKTSNVAKTSTGAASFMHRFSNTTREVAQNGRRGALMISMDVTHPDILDFVKTKRDLTKVTGANISVKLNNDFMDAVVNDSNYDQFFNYNGTLVTESIEAKPVWNEIIKSAHSVAEPGLMFWDNIVNYSPDGIYNQYKQITTNPCGEIAMQPYDACRLIAVNLFSFVDKPFTGNAKFNFDKFYEINYEAMRLSDNVVDLELEHVKRIIDKIVKDEDPKKLKTTEFDLWRNIYRTANNSRRTGLGFTGLGDMLAALGIKYSSTEALELVDKIMRKKIESELDCTTDLAITRGTFRDWDPNLEMQEKMDSYGMPVYGRNPFYEMIISNFPKQANRMYRHGRRNVSWSTVAPTGTVSILTQTTSGIEPMFQPFYTRRKKINPSDEGVKVDFVDKNGDSWTEYPVLHPKFKDWLLSDSSPFHIDDRESEVNHINQFSNDDLNELFKQSPWYGSTANDIDWGMRVEMQSTIQKYITHSISSTINLPKDVTEDEVSDIYLNAWKLGLKGVTVYRDGSRDGVLVTNTETKSDEFTYTDAKKRPKTLACDIHIAKYRGTEFVVLVGLYHDKPYEVFALENEWNIKPSVGEIIKIHKGKYNLNIKDDILIEDVTANMKHEEEALTRMLSFGLRHGGDITFAVEQLRKSEGDITAFSKSIARVLNKYTKEREEGKELCQICSSELVREEGCIKCKSCGYEKCG